MILRCFGNGAPFSEYGVDYNEIFSLSSSIGIIGGADGPTAITVASYNPWVYAVLAAVAVAMVVAAIAIIKKRRKK